MKIIIVLLLLITGILLVACQNQQHLVGNDRDSHGCIPSAGYTWCDAKQKCIRPWEENCTSTNTTITNCNYNDPNKSYIKNESNCVINFMCTKDKQAFSDECGCGCKTNSDQPVVANNTGLANPASTYCVNNGGTLAIITQQDGSQIGECTLSDGTKCEEWAYFRGECGKQKHICAQQEKQSQICPMYYIGVCGNDGKTYPNGCIACTSGVDSYVNGDCAATNSS